MLVGPSEVAAALLLKGRSIGERAGRPDRRGGRARTLPPALAPELRLDAADPLDFRAQPRR